MAAGLPQIVAAVGARERDERLGREAELVGKCQTDSLAAVIERKDASWFDIEHFGRTEVSRACRDHHIAHIIREA